MEIAKPLLSSGTETLNVNGGGSSLRPGCHHEARSKQLLRLALPGFPHLHGSVLSMPCYVLWLSWQCKWVARSPFEALCSQKAPALAAHAGSSLLSAFKAVEGQSPQMQLKEVVAQVTQSHACVGQSDNRF